MLLRRGIKLKAPARYNLHEYDWKEYNYMDKEDEK